GKISLRLSRHPSRRAQAADEGDLRGAQAADRRHAQAATGSAAGPGVSPGPAPEGEYRRLRPALLRRLPAADPDAGSGRKRARRTGKRPGCTGKRSRGSGTCTLREVGGPTAARAANNQTMIRIVGL